jgi:hypothetical protein
MEAVSAMDLSALSRRELQALCKLNGVRANMTNLAMAEALHSLPSVSPNPFHTLRFTQFYSRSTFRFR